MSSLVFLFFNYPRKMWLIASLSIERKSFELQPDDRFLAITERGNGRVARVNIPNKIVGKWLRFIDEAIVKHSSSLKESFRWNGCSFFASIGENENGLFLRVTEWQAKEDNKVVYFSAGLRLYGWISLGDLLRQMGWSDEVPRTAIELASIDYDNLNHPTGPNRRKQEGTTFNRSGLNGGAIIVDVWGVVVPWAAIATAINGIFRRNLPQHFDIKPLGYPTNRALFTTNSKEETNLIIKTESVKIGNGILCFQLWQPKITKLLSSIMEGNRWIRVWGIPLSAWNGEIFRKIGEYCGKLLMVDLKTSNRASISYACLKVEVESLNQIPRHMLLLIRAQQFDLYLEVKMGLRFSGFPFHARGDSSKGGGVTFGGENFQPLDARFFYGPSDTMDIRVEVSTTRSSIDPYSMNQKGKQIAESGYWGVVDKETPNINPNSNLGCPYNNTNINGLDEVSGNPKSTWVWRPKQHRPERVFNFGDLVLWSRATGGWFIKPNRFNIRY